MLKLLEDKLIMLFLKLELSTMSEVYTYQELRELALKHGIRDNKVHIGVWLQTQGYQKQRIQINHIRKIFYLKSHD